MKVAATLPLDRELKVVVQAVRVDSFGVAVTLPLDRELKDQYAVAWSLVVAHVAATLPLDMELKEATFPCFKKAIKGCSDSPAR